MLKGIHCANFSKIKCVAVLCHFHIKTETHQKKKMLKCIIFLFLNVNVFICWVTHEDSTKLQVFPLIVVRIIIASLLVLGSQNNNHKDSLMAVLKNGFHENV